MESFVQAFERWGWLGVTVLFAMDKLWPWFTNTFFPAKVKQEEDERTWQRSMDERRMQAMENMATTVGDALQKMSQGIQEGHSQLVLAVTVNNERLAQLNDAHRKHDAFTVQTAGDLRSAVSQMHGIIPMGASAELKKPAGKAKS